MIVLAGTRGVVVACPECGAPIQRANDGDLYDGMDAHYDRIHPGLVTPQTAKKFGGF